MSVDELLAAFSEELSRAGEADPRDYLRQVTEAERAELAALIEGVLDRAPDPPFDPARFAAWRKSDPGRGAVARVARATEHEESLVTLRDAAEIPRAKLVAGLARALGVSESPLRRRYHQLESGQLEPAGVSAKVWAALGDMLGRSAESVRAAAATTGPAAGGASGVVFARVAEAEAAPAPPPPASPGAEEPDDPEVDALFLGVGG